jgi:tetratricopeptide (TPR) repeat protein
LLTDLLGDASLAETPFASALIENAGGNPLFLEETVRTLRDRGLVDLERWSSEDVGELPVPTNVQGLISSRLDQLDPSEKRLAHHASVVGAVFWAGAVAHVGIEDAKPAPDPRPGLASLERRDFVAHSAVSTVAGEDEYAFKHILQRDVAYAQIPKGRRAQLHVRFSDWVTILPGSAEEFVEIVAWHLEQACRLSREVARSLIEPPVLEAAGALANAARRAELREGLREARRYYSRAIDVLGDAYPEMGLDLRLRRAIAVAELGELKVAADELAQVGAAAPAFGRAGLCAEALVAHADIDQRQGRATEAHERLADADAISREIDDRRLQVKAAFILSALRADLEGQFAPAVEDLPRAVTISEELDDLALRVEGHLRIGFLLYNMGELAGAEDELLRCTMLARDLGSHRDEARATFQLSLVQHYRRSSEEAERLALRAREWLARTGDTYMQVQNLHALARIALARADVKSAEQYLREGLETAVEIGGWLVVDTYRLLTEALVRQGRTEDARTLVAFAARNLPAEDRFARAAPGLAQATVATAEVPNAPRSTSTPRRSD